MMIRLAVVVATVGRPHVIRAMLNRLSSQSRIPDVVVLACSGRQDLPEEIDSLQVGRPYMCVICVSEKGLTRQRNTGVDWLINQSDICDSPDGLVVFLDDDFIMRSDWLSAAIEEFKQRPTVVGLTGILLADGTQNAGYSERCAQRMLIDDRTELHPADWRRRDGRVQSLYGCNMAFRAIVFRSLRFDETLPSYAWLEDYDFSRRSSQIGGLERVRSLIGIHLAEKRGRDSGVRFGYSQVANPLYLWKKGTMNSAFASKLIIQCILSNIAKSLSSEPYIDRRGRAIGNFVAIRDMISRRLSPIRINNL